MTGSLVFVAGVACLLVAALLAFLARPTLVTLGCVWGLSLLAMAAAVGVVP